MAQAAFELAFERGLEGFVVEDVVQRAGYSRRTFANYFSCKEEAVVMGAHVSSDIIEVENVLANLSEDTPLLDSLFQLIHMELTLNILTNLRKLVILSEDHPTLEPYLLCEVRRMEFEAYKILKDISGGKDDEAYIHLLVGAVYGAILRVVDGTLDVLSPDQTFSSDTFHQYLDKIYQYLRRGFIH